MSADAWVTVAVLVTVFVVLVLDRMAPSAVVLAAAAFLLVADVIDTPQALSGFANPAPITVAALYVLASAADKTSLLTPLAARLLGRGRTRVDLARLLVPVASASAFLNNTPLVAMLIPDVAAMCRRRGLSASRFLMPISFAAILGGTMTLLGTSTNLVVSGLVEDTGAAPLGLFEFVPVAAPAAVAGMVVLVVFAWRLVPERTTVLEDATDSLKEYVVTMRVQAGPLVGQRIGDTDLVGRSNVYLAQLTRGPTTFSPVDLELAIEQGDALTFVGEAGQVVDLYRVPGLRSAVHDQVAVVAGPRHRLHVAVVGASSPLAGSTLAEVGFAARYDAVVLAIHRDGQRVLDDPRLVRFRPGDALLVLADAGFRSAWSQRRDFLLIADLDMPPPHMSSRAPVVAAITVAMVLVAALGLLTIMEASLVAAGALVVTRTLSADEVRAAVDFDVVILIAASFALGSAVEATGLAQVLAEGVIGVFAGLGTAGIVFGLMVAMTLLTELVTNNAAVVVVFPIAAAIAARTGVDMRVLAIGLAAMASCSFLTPIGYQTNTMVYGPGGYRFTDYARVGLPLNVTAAVIITTMVMVLGGA